MSQLLQIKAVLAAVVALGLSACATTPPSAPTPQSPPAQPPPQSSSPSAREAPEGAPSPEQQAEAAAGESDGDAAQQPSAKSQAEQRAAADAASRGQRGEHNEANTENARQGEVARQSQGLGEADPQSPTRPEGRAAAGNGMTAEERMAALDRGFGESLGQFDERLAREQFDLEQQRQATAAEQAARNAAGGRGTGDGDGDGSGGMSMPPPPPSGGGFEGDEDGAYDVAQNPGGRSSPGNRAGLPVPDDVGDGRNDDIVARQLREAAERETDPELRERLWDEYREYKRSQR